jgi:hypothetical protein
LIVRPENSKQMTFSKEFLIALGNWQRGWREIQGDRVILAAELESEAAKLPHNFRSVSTNCYRKHFLTKGELVDIVLRDSKDYGLMSWTIDRTYAERFKGLLRADAVSAAIFQHQPTSDEVVVDVTSLWKCEDFVSCVTAFASTKHPASDALLNFRDTQGEVVLRTPLRGSEIIGLVGVSSPFDELCDRAAIPECERDRIFRELISDGVYAGEPIYLSPQGAQNVLTRTIETMIAKIESIKQSDQKKRDEQAVDGNPH